METLSISFDVIGILILAAFLVQLIVRELLKVQGGWITGGFEKRSLLNQMIAQR